MTQHVLVTGGAGYIGSHACKALDAAGYVMAPKAKTVQAARRARAPKVTMADLAGQVVKGAAQSASA